MLLYNNFNGSSNIFGVTKNKRKSTKKKYKSVNSSKKDVIVEKVSGGDGQKKNNKRKIKISKRNIKFLEGLGLRVKQN